MTETTFFGTFWLVFHLNVIETVIFGIFRYSLVHFVYFPTFYRQLLIGLSRVHEQTKLADKIFINPARLIKLLSASWHDNAD